MMNVQSVCTQILSLFHLMEDHLGKYASASVIGLSTHTLRQKVFLTDSCVSVIKM